MYYELIYIFTNMYLADLLRGKGHAVVNHTIPNCIYQIDEVEQG